MNLRALIPGRLIRFASRRRGVAPTRASRRRRAALAVGTAAVVYIVVHLALVVAPAVTFLASDPIYADKERRLRRLEAAAPPGAPRVVMLGTSRGGNAFAAGRAEVLARDAGTPIVVFNYGIIGAGPIMYRIYFERLLADGHRPDLLLIEVLPPLLADVPGGPAELQLSGDLLTRTEVETATKAGMPAGLWDQWRGSVGSPVFAHRFKLMGRLLPSVVPWPLRCDWGRTPDPNGWNAVPFEVVTDEQRARGEAHAAVTYQLALQLPLPAGPAAAALRDLLARCRAEGIATALVVCPEGSSFRALYPPHVGPRLDRFFAELTAEFGCAVIDARLWVEDRHFVDGHHLMRSGATRFTDRLTAEVIVPLVRAGRGRP